MAFKYCQHIKEGGSFCGSAALRGRRYCYFHLRLRARRLAMAKAEAMKKVWRLDLPALEDMHAVQTAIMQVVEALARGAVEPQVAKLILFGLQQAGTNVRHVGSWIAGSRFEVSEFTDMRAIDYPDLEAEFSLPKRVDLDAAPEDVFPPEVGDEDEAEAIPAKKPPTRVKTAGAAKVEDTA